MDKIRTIIVDDEPLARERLRSLLRPEPDFEIVAQCESGADAITAIKSLSPKVLFLDIQMPDIDGFEVLEAIPLVKLPRVVFVTAYESYAVKAFEVHALDYLLKPFDRDRFSAALDRVRQDIERDDGRATTERLMSFLENTASEVRKSRLVIKSAGRIVFLKTDEIHWIEAAGNYVRLHTAHESHLQRTTLAALEERLPREQFVRIHRSAIVNLDEILEIQPAFHGDFAVTLRNGTELTLSRRYRESFEDRLGKPL